MNFSEWKRRNPEKCVGPGVNYAWNRYMDSLAPAGLPTPMNAQIILHNHQLIEDARLANLVMKRTVSDLIAEQAAHSRTRRDLIVATCVCLFLAVVTIVGAVKDLRAHASAVQHCLNPATFKATQLEFAQPSEAARITL